MPLILGGAGGGLLLLILVIVLASGGGSKKEAAPADTGKTSPPPAPKKIVPDVSALEAEGKKGCEEGTALIRPRLNADSSAPKERVRSDLESGLKLLNKGIEAYEKAASLAGKTYRLDDYKKTRSQAIRAFCDSIEKEGQASCDEGLKIIQSTEGKMTGVAKLTDDEKKQLKTDLQKGIDLIRDGMNLFDRSFQVSGHTFETTQYTKARKAAAMKVGELK
jgi:hypothetical protein